MKAFFVKESLGKSVDKILLSEAEGLRTNGNGLIRFVVSLSNHEWNQLAQKILMFCRVDNTFLPTGVLLSGGQTKKLFVHPTLLIWQIIITLFLATNLQTPAYAMMEHGHMIMDDKGMIMNANPDRLPKDCQKISQDVDITIRAGHEHAQKFNGKCTPSTTSNGTCRLVPRSASPSSTTTTSATNS